MLRSAAGTYIIPNMLRCTAIKLHIQRTLALKVVRRLLMYSERQENLHLPSKWVEQLTQTAKGHSPHFIFASLVHIMQFPCLRVGMGVRPSPQAVLKLGVQTPCREWFIMINFSSAHGIHILASLTSICVQGQPEQNVGFQNCVTSKPLIHFNSTTSTSDFGPILCCASERGFFSTAPEQ
jgi:hypothetical protein